MAEHEVRVCVIRRELDGALCVGARSLEDLALLLLLPEKRERCGAAESRLEVLWVALENARVPRESGVELPLLELPECDPLLAV